VINTKGLGELFDVLWRGLCLAIEESGDSNFTAAKLIGNGFEVQSFGCFRIEEGFRGSREAVDKAGLLTLISELRIWVLRGVSGGCWLSFAYVQHRDLGFVRHDMEYPTFRKLGYVLMIEKLEYQRKYV
jgi:hypothetical protein